MIFQPPQSASARPILKLPHRKGRSPSFLKFRASLESDRLKLTCATSDTAISPRTPSRVFCLQNSTESGVNDVSRGEAAVEFVYAIRSS